MKIFVIVLMVIKLFNAQEIATRSSLLGPSNFNYHAIDPKKNLNQNSNPVTSRKGPVLFPPSPSPPPVTPLIVTSKPLIESIARSDLNRNLTSNSITDQSQINPVTVPSYLAEFSNYRPMLDNTFVNRYTISPTIGSNIIDDYSLPYTDVLNSVNNKFDKLTELETRTRLPPLYTLSQQTERKSLKTHHSYPAYDYQENYHSKSRQYNNDVSDENNSETAEDKNYAFSYTVRDQKTGDDFSHSQRRSGSATNGEYRVRLPDGRVQTVSYTADENGYNAVVKYDDELTPNSVEYHNYDAQNHKEARQLVKEEPKHDVNKLYAEYQSPLQSGLYGDTSKEYYKEYSTEYNDNNYAPHQSKFSALFEAKPDLDFKAQTSTVKPNYAGLEDVLSKALPNVQPTFNYYLKPETTTEEVVLIGGRNRFTNDPSDGQISRFIPSSPRSYLASTIANLRDRISSKPILSDSFINRINKYLSFN